jgi:hypothetical protein
MESKRQSCHIGLEKSSPPSKRKKSRLAPAVILHWDVQSGRPLIEFDGWILRAGSISSLSTAASAPPATVTYMVTMEILEAEKKGMKVQMNGRIEAYMSYLL